MNIEKIKAFPRKKSQSEISSLFELLEKSIKYIDSSEYQSFYQHLHSLKSDVNLIANVKKIEKESILSIEEIHQVVIILEAFHQNTLLFQKLFPNKKIDSTTFQSIIRKVVKPFRTFVDFDGQIEYARHPELRKLYEKRNQLDLKAKSVLNQLIRDYSKNEILQINTYDIFNDHFVLLIKTDRYSKDLGFIHARSDSGQTLYVEPKKLSAISNQRKDLSIEIEAVIYRICKDFTLLLKEYIKDIPTITRLVLALDHSFALAKFSYSHRLERPLLNREENFWLEDFYHPLLEDPVMNTINLGSELQGVMISGPNTGGKTLTLKTICLCSLFPHIGLFVPARNASIPIFKEIYFLSQDHQSLKEGLSSFAAETKNYLELANSLGQESIIFIDEIFNSTSSEEASSLALGFFDYFDKTTRPLIFVSTHHQMLKVKTHEKNKLMSAHVGFDADTGLPTYKLFFNSPGSSRALEIFTQLSKDFSFGSEIIESSKKILDKKLMDYEALLSEVSKKKSSLEKELKNNKEINQRLSNQLKAQEGVLKLKTQEEISKLRQELKKIKKKSYQVLDDIKSNKTISSKSVDKAFREIESEKVLQVEEDMNKYKTINQTPILDQSYIYKPLRKLGKVLKVNLNTKKVLLGIGKNFKVEAPFEDLAYGPKQKSNISEFSFNYTKKAHDSLSLDARGMRLDEFKNKVELMVSDLYADNLPYLEVIHGHGNGILKNWLRSFIKNNGELELDIPKESADGMTRIKLS